MKSGYGFVCDFIYACLQYEYVHKCVVCLHRSGFVCAHLNLRMRDREGSELEQCGHIWYAGCWEGYSRCFHGEDTS